MFFFLLANLLQVQLRILPLEGIALGVGETIPRGIPPGETDLLAMAAPLEGDGARKLDVGGFNRDLRNSRDNEMTIKRDYRQPG